MGGERRSVYTNTVLGHEQCSNVESLFVSNLESLPIPPWSAARERPVGAPAKTPLTREAIVEAALAVLDAEGLEGVSMRRVAQRLGTGPASLYQHVSNKDELLELVLDRVAGDIEIPEPGVGPDAWQAPLKDLLKDFGFSVEKVVDAARRQLGK